MKYRALHLFFSFEFMPKREYYSLCIVTNDVKVAQMFSNEYYWALLFVAMFLQSHFICAVFRDGVMLLLFYRLFRDFCM